MDRRRLLHAGLGLVATGPLACRSTSGLDGGAGGADAAAPDASTPAQDGGPAPDAATADAGAGDAGAEMDAGVAEAWARGGTAAMTMKAAYPDPFTAAPADCVLVEPTTAGPCTTEDPPDREDISEGWPGLPMRLLIRVVDVNCAPLAGATVEVWHTNLEGVYSGDTPAQDFCSEGDPADIAADYGRGIRTADARGVVAFDSCYPGWYPGRAIHVHFRVRQGGLQTRVSQLFFPEATTDEIFATHPDYAPFGAPDRTNSTDGVAGGVGQDNLPRLTCDVARMPDGAMLASATVAVAQ